MVEHPAVTLQLPQATVVEKLGEFREPYIPSNRDTATLSEA